MRQKKKDAVGALFTAFEAPLQRRITPSANPPYRTESLPAGGLAVLRLAFSLLFGFEVFAGLLVD
jgi:hypothetical protein